MLCSCERKNEKLIPLFEQTKEVMKGEDLFVFKSTNIDSFNFDRDRYRPRFYMAVEKNPSLKNDVEAYLDSKGISPIEPIRYLYLCFCFHMYLNKTSFNDEEIYEKIKQFYKRRRGIDLKGDLDNVVFPNDNVPERWN